MSIFGDESTTIVEAQDPISLTRGLGAAGDPASAFETFDAMLELGIVDTSILYNASPLAHAISLAVQNDVDLQKKRDIPILATDAFRRYSENVASGNDPLTSMSGKDIESLRSLELAGIDVRDLFEREVEYRAKIEPLARKVGTTADTMFDARVQARGMLAGIPGALPDISAGGIEGLKSAELDRLLRDIDRTADERGSDILRTANFGGFNPGRQLGKLEELRFDATQDADLDALGRALALIGGQQSAASTQAGVLSGFLGEGRQALAGPAALRSGSTAGGSIAQGSPRQESGSGGFGFTDLLNTVVNLGALGTFGTGTGFLSGLGGLGSGGSPGSPAFDFPGGGVFT